VRRFRGTDERGLVGRAAITLLFLIVVGGLAAIDGTAVLLAKLQTSDVADTAANAGATTYAETRDATAAKSAAIQAADDQDKEAKVTRFSIARDGTVTVEVRKLASTLIVRRVSFLRHFGVVRDTATAGP
jgi:Flp pilus assembly protein TadG